MTNVERETKYKLYEIIQNFNRAGFILLEIDDNFYSISHFDKAEVEMGTWRHAVKGKDITKIVNDVLNIGQLTEDQMSKIKEKILELRETTKYYQKDFKFILHLS